MLKNGLVRKTIYYLVMVLGVIIFGKLLGYENVFYAVTTCLILTRMRTQAVKLSVFFQYLTINILMFITSLTLQVPSWWNILFIFIVIYLIIKCFYIDRKTVAYFPFLVQYIFIVFKPITDLSQQFIINRAIALIIGPLVMLGLVLYNNSKYDPQSYIKRLINQLGTPDFHKSVVIVNTLFDDKFRETKAINQLVVQLNCLKVINFYINQLPTPISSIDDIYNYNLHQITNLELKQAIKTFQLSKTLVNPITKYQTIIDQEKIWFSVVMATIFVLVVIIGKWIYGYETRWFLIGLCAMLFPFYEDGVKKIRNLLISTILGGIVVIFLYYLFPFKHWPLALLLLCFYLATIITEFVKQKFFVTMGSILLILVLNSGNPVELSLMRISLFVLAGLISLVINKIFALDVNNLNRQQQRFYTSLVDRLNTTSSLTQLNYDSLKLFTINLYLHDEDGQHLLDLKVIDHYQKIINNTDKYN